MSHIEVIAFDADDTLWYNERIYVEVQEAFKDLLAHYHSREWIEQRLYATEMRNIQHFGYGIKAFALSMIETAVELTEGRIDGKDIQALIDLAKGMLSAEVELLVYVPDILAQLTDAYTLMLITKGDLRDQESKITRSGLADHFRHIEILSEKSTARYQHLLTRCGVSREHFLMVGNSIRSDILPVLHLGARAVYVPHQITWVHEVAEPPRSHPGFFELDHLGLLPGLLAEMPPAPSSPAL